MRVGHYQPSRRQPYRERRIVTMRVAVGQIGNHGRSRQHAEIRHYRLQADCLRTNAHDNKERLRRLAIADKAGVTRQPVGCLLKCMDLVFRALADESRPALVDSLCASSGQTFNEVCAGLAQGQLARSRQAVSKHLAILEEANLVVTVNRGRQKLHYLKPVRIGEIPARWMRKFERRKVDALVDLKRRLE